MAVVLEYGSKPRKPAAMYPFIQVPHPSEQAGSFPCQSGKQPYSLDGHHDSNQDNPFTRSKIGGKNPLDQFPTREHLNQQKGDPHGHDNHQTPVASDVDIDPNSDRRKRRKITPKQEGLDTSVRSIEAGNSGLSVRHGVASATGFHEDNDVQDLQSACGIATTQPAGMVSKAPKKTTPRKRRVQANQYNLESQSTQPAHDQPSPSKSKRSTPKKKTISLHMNGKLVSSPPNESLPPNESKTAGSKKGSQVGNIKMKNGKFVQSMVVVLKYGQDEQGRAQTGQRIDTALSKQSSSMQLKALSSSSKTHPFFLGKVKPNTQASERPTAAGDDTDNDSESLSRRNEPVAWKDLKFSKQRSAVFKFVESLRPAWPPLDWQHVGNELPQQDHSLVTNGLRSAKLKSRRVQLQDNEDVLHVYADQLKAACTTRWSIQVPAKRYLTGKTVVKQLRDNYIAPNVHDAISSVYSKIATGSSPFDRGECAGPNMWSLQYSPTRWTEVLQPSAEVLHQWLQALVIHNVKSGVDTNGHLRRAKALTKKKRRKLKDGLDDFIVASDDEQENIKVTKNAILLTGPNGCGKSASVFAVAKDLGFEVFEIHPGMRRSAKDIFDKVGDMAHNHLVQKGRDMSRGSSAMPPDADNSVDTDIDTEQATVANFLGPKITSKQKPADHVSQKAKREQKQSLILFEEVDLLFDDDKGFWNGVQNLIQNSKRPVVLTCNELSSIPLDDLDLFDILTYKPVEHQIAIEYLRSIAAAEGHLIGHDALSDLYASKANDLRASITELNLWCQMTVGSKQGGLDWMGKGYADDVPKDAEGIPLRIFSQDTFHKSLDLLPHIDMDNEAAIRFSQDQLGVGASEWCDFAASSDQSCFEDCRTNLQLLSKLSEITDARSTVDLFDGYAAPLLALATAGLCHTQSLPSHRDGAANRYVQQASRQGHKREVFAALEPIMVEKPTFPPSQGRLAPSLDTAMTSMVTDIAPFVRSIVSFDKRLEQVHDGLSSSQGKARKTRASRAAAEGGDKASTRSERWFPKDLDFEKVLETSGGWPQWYADTQNSAETASIASSSQAMTPDA